MTLNGQDFLEPQALRVTVIGNPESRRVAAFQESLSSLGAPRATVLAYSDLLSGRSMLRPAIAEGTILRIESPDRDFQVERTLIAAGAGVPDPDENSDRIGAEAALRLDFERGRILYPRQWYLGFRALLEDLDRQRAHCPPHCVMNAPAEIALMFDKCLCHSLFQAQGVASPRGLGRPKSYEELRQLMGQTGVRRVFVKLAHGSSASGVVALETDGRRTRATTTVELVQKEGAVRLYNTRAIRRYESDVEIAALLDLLCRERVHAEQWIPKASLPGGSFDLRVVVIAGKVAHVVVRQSRTPLTNLHLLNQRGDLDAVRRRMSSDAWEAMLASCEQAARLFPGSLYAGVDVVVASGFRRHAILEINAFGDLLPGITHDGLDTYTAELAALGVSTRGEAA